MKVVVVGSGNVAESLAQAIAEADGLELVPQYMDANNLWTNT